MAEFALVQAAMPTGTGTQDFTSSGFGTPKGAIFLATFGTANGTVATHLMLSIGMTDGTRSRSTAWASKDGVATADPAVVSSTTAAVITVVNTGASTIDGSANFDSWITDGVRINWTDAPPTAYLLTVILIGGSGVANVRVDNASSPTVIDTATDVTAPGFTPDLVFTVSRHSSSLFRGALGMVVNDGSNTQRSASYLDDSTNPSESQGRLDTNSVANVLLNGAELQIQGFDANGFDLFLRVVTGTAYSIDYMAIDLTGINAKVLTSAAPTATGDHTITGAGWIPQFGIMFHTEAAAVDTDYTADNFEVMGIGVFTSAAAYSVATYEEDNVTPSDTNCITDNKPVRVYKNNADYMVATFVEFTSDGVTFNYSTTQAAAKQRAVLFVQDTTARNDALAAGVAESAVVLDVTPAAGDARKLVKTFV